MHVTMGIVSHSIQYCLIRIVAEEACHLITRELKAINGICLCIVTHSFSVNISARLIDHCAQ